MKHNPMAILSIVLSVIGIIAINICMVVIDNLPIGLFHSLLVFYLLILIVGIFYEKTWHKNKWKNYYDEVVKPNMNMPIDKQQRRKDIFICSYLFIGIALTIFLSIKDIMIGIIVFAVFIIGIFIQVRINTEKEQKMIDKENEMYGAEQAPRFDSFYFGCFYMDKGEINIDIIREAVNMIANRVIEIPTSIYENEEKEYQKSYIADYILEQLTEFDDCVSIDFKTELEDLVWNINRVIDKKKIPIKELTLEQITAFDNDCIKACRNNNMATMDNDINVAHDIIEKQGYELINVLSDEYCLTIVSQQDFEELKKLEAKI